MVAMSVAVAIVFFQLGGSVAEVTNQTNGFLGVTFKAGGGLAGFIITLLILNRIVNQIRDKERQLLREYLLRFPTPPTGPGPLNCSYRLYDTLSGDWSAWKPINYLREGGALKILVREMEPRHVIGVQLANGTTEAWQSIGDHAYGVSDIPLQEIPVGVLVGSG